MPVVITVAAIARVCMLAAKACTLPVMSRERLAPTSAVLAMLGAAPCTAPKNPSSTMANGETFRRVSTVDGPAGGSPAGRSGVSLAMRCSLDGVDGMQRVRSATQTENDVKVPPVGKATSRDVLKSVAPRSTEYHNGSCSVLKRYP